MLEFVTSFVDSHNFVAPKTFDENEGAKSTEAEKVGAPIHVKIPRTTTQNTVRNNIANYLSPSSKIAEITRIQQEDLANLNIEVQSPPAEPRSVEE